MNQKTFRTALLASAFVSASAIAQTPDHLVGLTRNAPALLHHDHWNCQTLNACPVGIPPTGAGPQSAGGTGWDPVRPGAWISNGLVLAKVSDNCQMLCPPMPIPGLATNAFITGIDVVESLNQLLLIDNQGFLHTFSNTCPPQPISICQTGLVPQQGASTSGLATDEGNGLIFVAYSNFNTGANNIAIIPLANQCQPICRVPVQPPCNPAFRPITGLAVDWGQQALYATDGFQTIAINYSTATPCPQFVNYNCCTPPIINLDPMIGLAVRPGGATSTGQSCANGACANCNSVLSLGNDPNLGNALFRVNLDQAPVGSLAWCIFGTAPCQQPGVSVPGLCGPVYTPQPLLGVLGPNVVGGGLPCSGSTSFGFPLPPWPSLAGWTISAQSVSLCTAAAGVGTAISNCLSFTLQGS
ncbi:MAG: hypothetical protein NXI31_23285 [bacterium]|nr:hypothetical protein [bacterium]